MLNYTATIKKMDVNQSLKNIEEKNANNNNEDAELNEIIKKYEKIQNKNTNEADDILLKGEINFDDKEKVQLQNVISDYENEIEDKVERNTNELANNSEDNSYEKYEKENVENNNTNKNEYESKNENYVEEEEL